MKTKNTILLAIAWAVAASAGCKDSPSSAGNAAGSETAATIAPTAPAAGVGISAAKEAGDIFTARCTPCHGALGRGDGAASAGLTPRPANLASPEWQKGVTDDHIDKIIVYGGMAVNKSAAMPPNPDLDAKPEVVKALRAHIRSLAK